MLGRSLLIAYFLAAVCALECLIVFDPAVQDLENDISLLNPKISKFLTDYSINYEVKSYTDTSLDLFVAGQVKYDYLILLPASKRALAKKNFNQHTLLDFVNNEGNILAVGESNRAFPEDIKAFLNEVGIFPSPKGYVLTDHFNANGDGSVQLSFDSFVAPKILPAEKEPVSYNGGAALISNNENIIPIIRASATSFTFPIEDDFEVAVTKEKLWTVGQQGFLAVGVQALNNARLAWIGSESLLDEELLKWNFQQKGALKLQFVSHIKEDVPQVTNSTLYRIKDQVIYTIGVSEYKNGEYIPFEVTNEDEALQLSFKMLDPYQRLNLQPLGPVSSIEDGPLDTFAYYVNFTLPDHHGMFTFELDYKRTGLSYLLDKKIVAVRHLANDEYKRSWDITNAWVYIASAGAVAVAWFLFVVNFIYIGNVNYDKKKQ